MLKYKHAGIAGKFRLLHKAHVELILRAICYTEHLHIFIVDLPTYKRYATIDKLKQSFIEIFRQLDYPNYHIHIIKENLSGQVWDEKLLELVPTLETMFDSKEVYGNILVNNEFIKLDASSEISVTNIEQNLYDKHYFYLITKEFRQYINKKIVITGKSHSGITSLTKKLTYYYNVTANFDFNTVNDHIALLLAQYATEFCTYLTENVINIVQDFSVARRMLLINDDVIKLYYTLLKTETDILAQELLTPETLATIYKQLEILLASFVQDIDYYIYCTDNPQNDELLVCYQKFISPEKLAIVATNDYLTMFNKSIAEINAYLKIEG